MFIRKIDLNKVNNKNYDRRDDKISYDEANINEKETIFVQLNINKSEIFNRFVPIAKNKDFNSNLNKNKIKEIKTLLNIKIEREDNKPVFSTNTGKPFGNKLVKNERKTFYPNSRSSNSDNNAKN